MFMPLSTKGGVTPNIGPEKEKARRGTTRLAVEKSLRYLIYCFGNRSRIDPEEWTADQLSKGRVPHHKKEKEVHCPTASDKYRVPAGRTFRTFRRKGRNGEKKGRH